jgi:hypothetical protein
MTGSLRLTDLVLLLGAIALATVLVGHQASSGVSAGAPEPLTITQAVAFYSDGPLVVRGYLVVRSGRTLLCERPRCAGPRLSVRGRVGRRARSGSVLALGIVTERRIALVRLTAAGGPLQRL